MTIMTETADLYVSCLRPLCFTFAASMFHACGLYVSCLRPLSTTHGYDKGRIAFWGARKRLGRLLCFVALRGGLANNGAGRRAWNIGAGFVLLYSCFSVVLFVVRSFWSFFSWFVLLVRAFGRSFRGSCFWFVFLVRSSGSCFWGLVCVFLFDALNFLEACVARSEVS